MTKTHAEFLEELKEECEIELKNKLFLSEGQIMTYQYFLEKIKQFQVGKSNEDKNN